MQENVRIAQLEQEIDVLIHQNEIAAEHISSLHKICIENVLVAFDDEGDFTGNLDPLEQLTNVFHRFIILMNTWYNNVPANPVPANTDDVMSSVYEHIYWMPSNTFFFILGCLFFLLVIKVYKKPWLSKFISFSL